jgi:CubicO group peptidase (beta-lactamase class C family)
MFPILSLLLVLPAVDPGLSEAEAVVQILEKERKKADAPGMVAAIVRGDKVVSVGASGQRKDGDPTPMTAADLLHLGSISKSMTATMIATLIEEGKLGWDTPLAKVFPHEAESWHADWRTVTLHQLLTHTASMPDNINLDKLHGDTTTDRRRAILTQDWLTKAPDPKPGTHFHYSNVGYLLAALMAETITGKSWEDLMHERLFQPLGMKQAGFGAPGMSGTVDQPRGHVLKDGKHYASRADNPPTMGPAGTVHASVADWAKFVVQHLQSERDETKTKLLLKPETFHKLHTPVMKEYACGWRRIPFPGKTVPYLWHNGSNTFWYAEMWLDPENDRAVLVATNQGGEAAEHAVQSAAGELLKLSKK